MSKLRRLMNRLSHGALTSVAALALTVTATNMNRCCWFLLHLVYYLPISQVETWE